MKILMLNYEFPPLGGGAAPVTKELCAELSKRGHDVDVVTMGYESLPEEEEFNRVTIYRVKCVRKKKESSTPSEMFTYILSAYPKCVALMKEKKYDLIHAHFIIPTGILAYKLKKRFGVKYMITSHGSDVPGYNPDRFIFLHKLTFPAWKKVVTEAEFIVTPSESLKHLILKNKKLDNVKVIPNGIYFKKAGRENKERIILYAGRLFRRKGVQHILRAVDGLKGWRIIIAGDGDYKEKLLKIAEDVDADIEFKGWIPKKELDKIYRKSSIFILPSTQESFGMVIAEAMMYSNAIITTKDTACQEVVGDAGLLVEKNSPEDIREKIDLLADNPVKLKQYQYMSAKKVKEYSWDRITDMYLALYGKLH